MTCDSDGKIATFITNHGTQSALPVHPVKPRRGHIISQRFSWEPIREILGDMHNPSATTNAKTPRRFTHRQIRPRFQPIS